MPAERVAMRVVREVLRLTFAGVSKREVARRTGMAASTVRATIARFELLGLVWPLPETITDSDLEAKIYSNRYQRPTSHVPEFRAILAGIR